MRDPRSFMLPFPVRDMLAFEGAASFDLLIVTCSDVAVPVEVSGMTREGPFIFNFTTGTGSTPENRNFGIPDIPISVSVRIASLTFGVNEVHALAYLRINQTRVILLCQGFLGHLYGINWPSQSPLVPLQLRGKMTGKNSDDPAAGAELSLVVPTGQYWILKALRLNLTTSVAVANRRVNLVITPPVDASVNIELAAAANQTASQTYSYNWFEGAQNIDDQISFTQNMPLPSNLILPSSTEISTLTTNMQAADNLSVMEAFFELFYSVI